MKRRSPSDLQRRKSSGEMGWLPWKKKKSELEEKDRQRNVPPLNYSQESKDNSPAKRSGPTYIGGNENHTAAERAAAAGTPAKKGLPSDAILTPCYRGDTEKVRELLSGKLGTVDVHACDALGNSALHLAAFNGHLEVMRLLIQGGADPNMTNGEQDTALYMAVLSNDIECVKCIANCDVELNCTNIEGFTPLHYAAGEGNVDIVRYLVEERGAETEIPDNLGLTPGFCAVLQGREAVAEYLLSTNPEGVHARNMSSDTMLHCALKANAHKELVKLLLVNGADIAAVGADNMSAEKMLIARGHSDLIASARRASIAEEGEQGVGAAPRSRPQGPTQIPWLKKYISTFIDTGNKFPSKPSFKDSKLGDEWESHLISAH